MRSKNFALLLLLYARKEREDAILLPLPPFLFLEVNIRWEVFSILCFLLPFPLCCAVKKMECLTFFLFHFQKEGWKLFYQFVPFLRKGCADATALPHRVHRYWSKRDSTEESTEHRAEAHERATLSPPFRVEEGSASAREWVSLYEPCVLGFRQEITKRKGDGVVRVGASVTRGTQSMQTLSSFVLLLLN